jgi:hypothetical protein
MVKKLVLLMLILCLPLIMQAEDRIELKTTTIKGNKELPRVLYIVPWKDVKTAPKPRQELVLHSLFGDLFDPVVPVR